MTWENLNTGKRCWSGNDEHFRTNRSRNGCFCRALSRPDLQLLGAPRYVVNRRMDTRKVTAFCFKIQNGNDENLVFL